MNRQGRYFLSDKFKKFERKIQMITLTQYKQAPLEGDIHVTIVAGFTNKRHSDCGNLGKGVLDALQKIIYNNDRQVKIYGCTVLENQPIDFFTVIVEEMNK